jgi:hypothetical protein
MANGMKRAWMMGFVLGSGLLVWAQAPEGSTITMKQIMVDLIHPASNDVLLLVYRGGSKDEKDWAAARRGAAALAESGSLLAPRVRDAEWAKYSKALADAGAAAYKAARARDANALAAVADWIDSACTGCHKQYRPNVFPREGGAK